MTHSLIFIEDDADIRRLIEIMLRRDERLRLEQSFDNAADALVELRDGCCPEAILCDVGLPGMSGLEAIPLLREACPNAVIVMYTGDPERSFDALTLGADEVVGKDTLPMQLFEHVVELLQERTHQ